MFKRLDKDGDNKISLEEAPERMAQNFDRLDKNGEGYLTHDELRPPGGPGGPRGPRGDGQ